MDWQGNSIFNENKQLNTITSRKFTILCLNKNNLKNKIIQIFLKKCSTNNKKPWDGIKSIVTLKTKAKILSDINGITITNKMSIAEIFNIFCQYWFQSCIKNSKS